MTIHDLAEYEILDEHRVEDVQSDGFILRQKKVVQGLPFYPLFLLKCDDDSIPHFYIL